MKNDVDFDSIYEVVKKTANPIKPVGQPTMPMNEKSQIILSLNKLLAMKGLRAMLVTRKRPTAISSQCIFKLLTQWSVPSTIDLSSNY